MDFMKKSIGYHKEIPAKILLKRAGNILLTESETQRKASHLPFSVYKPKDFFSERAVEFILHIRFFSYLCI